jgi:nitroreductase
MHSTGPIPIDDLVRGRRSVRRYCSQKVDPDVLQRVIQLGENSVPLATEIEVQFVLALDGSTIEKKMKGIVGDYGKLIHSPHYVVALSEEKPHFLENMGFRMEQMILEASSLGLGTCWIGGLFREDDILETVGAPKGLRVIALTPLGYPDEKFYGRMVDRMIRMMAPQRAKRKNLEEIACSDHWGSPAGNLLQRDKVLWLSLEMARLAPSWANLQPWRFVIVDQGIILTIWKKETPVVSNVKDGKPYYRLDGGIAMCHFYLTWREAGRKGAWKITGFDDTRLRKQCGIPRDVEILGFFPTILAG